MILNCLLPALFTSISTCRSYGFTLAGAPSPTGNKSLTIDPSTCNMSWDLTNYSERPPGSAGSCPGSTAQ